MTLGDANRAIHKKLSETKLDGPARLECGAGCRARDCRRRYVTILIDLGFSLSRKEHNNNNGTGVFSIDKLLAIS
jgi:hypothetical protein